MSDTSIKLDILTPMGAIRDGIDVPGVEVPGVLGELGVLPRHEALITAIVPGVIRFREGVTAAIAWNPGVVARPTGADKTREFLVANAVLLVPVGVFGVTSAYTLINSAFGVFGANNGSVEFFGTSAYYKVDLIQGQISR